MFIESTHWRLWSNPDSGVQWLAAQVKHRDQWHDVIPDCRSGADIIRPDGQTGAAPGQSLEAPLVASNFYMIPYSNRIRDGRFSFQGNEYQLENAQRHAIHGALRKLPWQLVSVDENSLICEFDSHSHAQLHSAINWPWPIHARIEQTVIGDTLSSTISIRNKGESDMPVGTGWHPYFVRQVAESMPTLTLPVSGVFPDAEGDCLPDGAAIDLPPELDFRQSRLLDPAQRIDCCLAGLNGPCHIHWKEAGIELVMQSSEACRYLVLFNPDMPHFAVEPVSNANDAFNLSSQNIDSGTQTLAPEELFSVTMTLQARLHD